jgi:hypothetical protein
MDDALLKVVEANKVALQKLTDGGASFEESSVKKGLKELEAFEEKFLDGVKQAAQSSSEPIPKALASRLKNNGNQFLTTSRAAQPRPAPSWRRRSVHDDTELCDACERSSDGSVGGP